MAWLAALTFAVVALAGAWLAWTLTANLTAQPEYPTIMTDTMRVLGGTIAVGGAALGVVFLVYAVRAYFGV
ncbi:hypothetical protein [Natronobiforma cellulositropha]|uniref:hypothetical protein n=1 Tax=Natronobiforma cellulositropha TaxID=1679076 RepID=UPI0021D5E066|nr:hypothetical protein [Natronobiforma cellulositropha]